MRDHGLSAHRWIGGTHRAQGLAGSTRRYAVIVVLLAALASLPTLAAISAGSSTLGATGGEWRTSPFVVQPSGAPVVVVPPPARPRMAAHAADARPRPRPLRRDRARTAAPGAPAPRAGTGRRTESVRQNPAAPRRPARVRPAPEPDESPRLGWRPFAPGAPFAPR